MPGTLGLAEFTVRVSQRDEFAGITKRLAEAGRLREPADAVARREDLDGLTVRLAALPAGRQYRPTYVSRG